jgi:hypothetical protein
MLCQFIQSTCLFFLCAFSPNTCWHMTTYHKHEYGQLPCTMHHACSYRSKKVREAKCADTCLFILPSSTRTCDPLQHPMNRIRSHHVKCSVWSIKVSLLPVRNIPVSLPPRGVCDTCYYTLKKNSPLAMNFYIHCLISHMIKSHTRYKCMGRDIV